MSDVTVPSMGRLMMCTQDNRRQQRHYDGIPRRFGVSELLCGYEVPTMQQQMHLQRRKGFVGGRRQQR